MPQVRRHKVFISFHHQEDQEYKDRFVEIMKDDMVNRSVGDGDIDASIHIDTVRREIRDNYIADATVTVVLIGPYTWRRKHVDWEIQSSLKETEHNMRNGLLGIFLPTHPDFEKEEYNPHLIPPRLADNCGEGSDPYACLYDWEEDAKAIREWIHRAFKRRKRTPPKNSRQQFANNRQGDYRKGWQH